MPLSGTAPSARPYSGLFGGAEPPRAPEALAVAVGVAVRRVLDQRRTSARWTAKSIRTWRRGVRAGGRRRLGRLRPQLDDTAAIGAYANGSQSWVEAYEDIGKPVDVPMGCGRQRRVLQAAGPSGTVRRVRQRPVTRRTSSSGCPTSAPVASRSLPSDIAGLDYALARDPSVSEPGARRCRTRSTEGRRSKATTLRNSADLRRVGSSELRSGSTRPWAVAIAISSDDSSEFAPGTGTDARRFGDPDSRPIANHFIDVGVDAGYGRSYALTRRTTFSFSTNSSVFVEREPADGRRGDRSTPDAGCSSAARRPDSHDGAYVGRRTGYNARRVLRGGLSTSRCSPTPRMASSAGSSRRGSTSTPLRSTPLDSVGFSGDDNGYGTSTAVASLRLAISRHLAAYAQYFYYHY